MAGSIISETRQSSPPSPPPPEQRAADPEKGPDTRGTSNEPDTLPQADALPQERWNNPRSNILRTIATFWAFLVMGANDSAYGVSPFQLSISTNNAASPSIRESNPTPSAKGHLTMDILPARTILHPLLHNRLPGLPLPNRRIHPGSIHKQHTTHPSRPARDRLPLARLPSNSLHRQLHPPAVPGSRGLVCLRGSGERARGVGVECVDREDETRGLESDAGAFAWVLWCWGGHGAACGDEFDY